MSSRFSSLSGVSRLMLRAERGRRSALLPSLGLRSAARSKAEMGSFLAGVASMMKASESSVLSAAARTSASWTVLPNFAVFYLSKRLSFLSGTLP